MSRFSRTGCNRLANQWLGEPGGAEDKHHHPGASGLQRSRRFYREGPGLPLREDSDVIADFETGGAWLALFPQEQLASDDSVSQGGHGFGGLTIAHNVRTREQVEQVLAEAGATGATILRPAQDTDWDGYSGYFADPGGFMEELA